MSIVILLFLDGGSPLLHLIRQDVHLRCRLSCLC